MFKPITVEKLTQLLSGLNPNAIVRLEGCDCEEYCAGISMDNNLPLNELKDVLLRRTDTDVFGGGDDVIGGERV